MKSRVLFSVSLVGLMLVSASNSVVSAQGFSFSSGGVHVGVGYPPGYMNTGYGNCASYGNYGGYYSRNPYTTYYGGGWAGGGGHSHWHDTTHLDYHPGEYVRHRNHYHYVPGHYGVHENGHWDHHGF
jgi:hypothetical protein